MAPVGSAGCPSVCPPAGFTALAVSTGCRRQLFSSIKILLPFRAKKQVQITTTQVNAKTSFLSPGIAVTLWSSLSERMVNMEPSRERPGFSRRYSGLVPHLTGPQLHADGSHLVEALC